ncbi:MAG: HAD family hydrolase [Pseudomonadota bacterium]
MLVSGSLPVGRPVDLVIFDCDGVLIDSEVISTRSTVEVLASLGYEISEAEASSKFVGRSYASVRSEIETDWGKPLPPSFEVDVEQKTLRAMATSLQPIKGVGEALSKLKLPRCVASSSSIEWIRRGLERTGVLHHLAPHFFSASMVENGKPAPDIFLHAAGEMGALPESCLVIEDSLPGVQAGVAAGAIVIGFTGGSHIVDKDGHGERLIAAGAAGILDDMRRLPDVISADLHSAR